MIYGEISLKTRVARLNKFFLILVLSICAIGFVMLYSAGKGSWYPWAFSQMVRFIIGFLLMISVALIPIRYLMHSSYVLYGLCLALLLAVDLFGRIGMGAQRWLNFYMIRLQPSELMRLSLVLTLACYFHRFSIEDIQKFKFLLLPVLLIMVPSFLVIRQPDLGTALILIFTGFSMLFFGGVQLRYFVIGIGILGSFMPIAWHFILHSYQKKRVLTFLNPEADPLGTGYHIMQSKIAMGSGGLLGKGFLKGTQSYLNFLPEKQTDFIFTMLSEEFGFVGGITLLFLYAFLISYGFWVASKSYSVFGKLLALGITGTLLIYVFINIGMVSGILPVVGVPLPFVSYGGTSLIALMVSFGLLLNVEIHSDVRLSRY